MYNDLRSYYTFLQQYHADFLGFKVDRDRPRVKSHSELVKWIGFSNGGGFEVDRVPKRDRMSLYHVLRWKGFSSRELKWINLLKWRGTDLVNDAVAGLCPSLVFSSHSPFSSSHHLLKWIGFQNGEGF